MYGSLGVAVNVVLHRIVLPARRNKLLFVPFQLLCLFLRWFGVSVRFRYGRLVGMDLHIPYLREVLIILAVTAILIPAFAQVRLNPVVGFLIAGIAIGPYGFGRLGESWDFLNAFVIHNHDEIRVLGEFGVVFLLFSIGLELSPDRLWSLRRMIFGLGSAQVFITALLIGAVAAAWGNPLLSSVVIGCALALSSTAVVMKMMMDRQHFFSPAGQASFSILLLQDLAVVPMLFLVTLSGQSEGVSPFLALVVAFLKAALVINLILLAGRFLFGPLLRFVAGGAGGSEFFTAQILMIVLCAAWATGAAGLSMALGAFLAGLLLAETEFRNQIEVDIAPFKGLLMGIFFLSIGMSVDLSVVRDNLVWLVVSIPGLFALKTCVIAFLCRAFGLPWVVAIQTGLMLGQAGEFAFVLLSLAMTSGAVSAPTGQFMMLLTGLTLVFTPVSYHLSEKVAAFMSRRAARAGSGDLERHVEGLSGHVVIAGFGRTGQAVADILDAHQIPHVALDLNAYALTPLRQEGKPVFYGDASQPRVLDHVGARRARVIVLAMDDRKSSRRAIENIRRHCPGVSIFARARDPGHAKDLVRRGVDGLVFETVEMSLQLAGHVLRTYDYPVSNIAQALDGQRTRLEAQQSPSGKA